ncbi:MAG: hypothetical protein EBQ63_06680 [Actinobacteria bacterium]|nr:hypothetical protein [Actinomycetota bacterium]
MATTNAPEGWLNDFHATGKGDRATIGVILVHGFTGSPASMRPWAHFLNERGFTVSVPRIPGHGTEWQDLNAVAWPEWPARVQTEIDNLSKHARRFLSAGYQWVGKYFISNVAQPIKISGIVLVNPMIHIPGIKPMFRHIISRLKAGLPSVGDDIKKPGVTEWGYDVLPTKGVVQLYEMLKAARRSLKEIKTPMLLFHSVDDHVLPVSNTEIIMAEIASADKQRVELTNSYHVATMDFDAELIFENSKLFIDRLS